MIPDTLLSLSALRGCMGSQQACTCMRVNAPSHPLHSTQSHTQRLDSLALGAPLICSSITCQWLVMAFGIRDQETVVTANVNPAALPPPCLSLTQRSVSNSTGKGNRSTSLRNVHNGLLCYCSPPNSFLSLQPGLGILWQPNAGPRRKTSGWCQPLLLRAEFRSYNSWDWLK